jgi:transposase
VSLTPEQPNESKAPEPVLEAVRLRRSGPGRPSWRSKRLAGDKGSSYPQVRRYLRRRGIKAVIPTRKGQRRAPRFDKESYRRRNVVERCVSWLKEERRLTTGHEKLAVNVLATAKTGYDPWVFTSPRSVGRIVVTAGLTPKHRDLIRRPELPHRPLPEACHGTGSGMRCRPAAVNRQGR